MAERVVGKVVSVRVGTIRTLGEGENKTRSAFMKEEVAGRAMARTLGLDGDHQADKRYHGGPDMALLGYSAEHYPAWIEETGILEMGPGGFGENLTITGLDESKVAIGDVHRIGTARLQVCQHRGPCSKIEKRWCMGGLVKRVTETARCGWYYRVLAEGEMGVGDEVVLEESQWPELTVQTCFWTKVRKDRDLAMLDRLIECPAIAPGCREELEQKR